MDLLWLAEPLNLVLAENGNCTIGSKALVVRNELVSKLENIVSNPFAGMLIGKFLYEKPVVSVLSSESGIRNRIPKWYDALLGYADQKLGVYLRDGNQDSLRKDALMAYDYLVSIGVHIDDNHTLDAFLRKCLAISPESSESELNEWSRNIKDFTYHPERKQPVICNPKVLEKRLIVLRETIRAKH